MTGFELTGHVFNDVQGSVFLSKGRAKSQIIVVFVRLGFLEKMNGVHFGS